jgi:NADH-quinone oxidoreductase subunit L
MDYSVINVAPIVLLPFLAFAIGSVTTNKSEKFTVALSCSSILISFLFAFRIFLDFWKVYSADYYIHKVFNWFDLTSGNLTFAVDLGIYIDNMTAIMLLMVTGAASLIHLFSVWYMKGDEGGRGRFFVYMSLFTTGMLGLVLSDNLLSVFIFWELMGFCSYSLIGFYNKNDVSGSASVKAFMTTRVGDVFFLLGILAIWNVIGNVRFVDIYAAISSGVFVDVAGPFGWPMLVVAAVSIFLGTIGKSAQFPLNVWLPDAMKGPTPCSALIHAATMVAAGVYLSLRMYPLMDAAGITYFIALIGGITAFGAATIALIQTDLKAVLAFSTISQLGFMVLGIGVGAYNPAFMHLITHAVFKACLFLSAGSIIHSVHEQEMPRLGGLRKKMPITFWCMMLCTLAIAGVPIWSGFVSKDRILGDALYLGFFAEKAWYYAIPAVLGFSGALLTAFYMFRMMFLTFFGQPRDKHLYDHAHHEHFSVFQNLPLIILAIFTFGFWFSGSLTGQGFVKFTSLENKDWFKTLVVVPDPANFKNYTKQEWLIKGDNNPAGELTRSVYSSVYHPDEKIDHAIHHAHGLGAIISIIIAFFGILFAYLMYIKKAIDPGKFVSAFSGWYRWLQNKYFMDHLYIDVIIKKLFFGFNNLLSRFDLGVYDRIAVDGWEKVAKLLMRISKWFDDLVIDSIGVDGTGVAVRVGNLVLKTVQSGKIQFYFTVLIVVLCGYIYSI